MRLKALLTVVSVLALLALWVPSASAVKWSFGNGQADLSVDVAPGTTGAVCGTHITGFAGEGTSVDPAVTPPPAPSTSGFTVELYVGANGTLGGAEVVAGGLKLLDDTVVEPLQTVTTAPPTALDPPDEYTGFDPTDKIWEYSAAPFTFNVSPGIPAWSDIVIVHQGNTAYYQTTAFSCPTTSLTSSKNPSGSGESVTFTATVTDENGQPVTTGGVEYSIDGIQVAANVPLDATGKARFTTSVLGAGDHPVSAMYLGAQSFPTYAFASSTASLTQTVATTDQTAPKFGPCKGGPFLLNTGNKPVSITAADNPGGSGLNAAASTLTGSVSTSSVGAKTVKFTAQDNAGNTATKRCTYKVNYVFSGLVAPVDNNLLNVATAGWTVPFRFSVFDGTGAPVTNLTSASTLSAAYTCKVCEPTDPLEEYATGSAGLKNLGGGKYQFNFTTQQSWAGTCRTLGIRLGDGVRHSAHFKFRA